MSRYTSSGANNTPLGSRAGGGSGSSGPSLLKPEYLAKDSDEAAPFKISGDSDPDKKMQALQTIMNFNAEQARKRAASAMSGGGDSGNFDSGKADSGNGMSAAEARAERKRKRKSRWAGGDDDKTFIPGMPTMMPQGLTKEQEEAYLLQLKIEDTSRKLRSGDMGIPLNPDERSPSPEPIYSSDGKRLNTREYRKRKELEETRHEAITRMMSLNTDYKPPPDYKPPQIKVNDRVMIPQDDHPEINFVGLLIGPRGNTLKSMEKETGAKIIIRGKGSVKEGKVGRKDGQPLPGEDEPLHAYVTATNPEAVQRAVIKIKEVITQGVEVPEGQNDLRRNQLRELALLNGTLREGEGPRCTNCGASDHKAWQCQDKPNMTNNIVCTSCGGVGHIAKDCGQKRPGSGFGEEGFGKNKMDDEYLSLMAELGEAPPPGTAPSSQGQQQQKPWQRGTGGGFNRPMAPPKAIMGPPRGPAPPPPPPGEYGAPPPPPGTGSGWNSPPGMMKQQPPPQAPWQSGGASKGNWNQPPPPPGSGSGPRGAAPPPPPGMAAQPWGGPPSGQGYGMPPPSHYMGAPPPSSASGNPSSWGSAAPWGGGPPPPPGTPQAQPRAAPPQPYWQQQPQWGGPPPGPQPVAPPVSNDGGLNLSNLISAPPPPPPT